MISLHGLNLAFMRKNPLPKKRGRPRKRENFTAKRSDLKTPYFVGDIKPFVNVANPERTHEITSRSQLRAFERSFGCFQVGNDFGIGNIAAKNDAKLRSRQERAKGIESGWNDI